MIGDEDSFYVFLPSNSSLDFFPDSTLSSYRVRLPSTVTLNGSYDVGLKELHYPHNFISHGIQIKAPEDELVLLKYDRKTLAPEIHRHGVASIYDNHSNLEILSKKINAEIKVRRRDTYDTDPFYTKKKDSPRIEYDSQLGKFVIFNDIEDKYYIKLHLSPTIAKKFGFEPSQFSLDIQKIEQVVYAAQAVKILNYNFDYVYLYTDIVCRSVVGNKMAPLLRVVDVQGKQGDIISVIFEQPLYIPVLKRVFNNIHIQLATDTGQNIPFADQGRVISVLHFRRSINSQKMINQAHS